MGPSKSLSSPFVNKGEMKLRDCIQCRKPFKSTGPGNRICQKCKARDPMNYDGYKPRAINAFGRRGRFGDEPRDQ